MEYNTVEIDTRTDYKEWASSVDLCQRHEPQHPHHVKVSPRGPDRRLHLAAFLTAPKAVFETKRLRYRHY